MAEYNLSGKAKACLVQAQKAAAALYSDGANFVGNNITYNAGAASSAGINAGVASRIIYDETYKPCMDGAPTFNITPKVAQEPSNAR